jgi:bifunctional UDP-N-acetylglucosamine pyrophosphorylase/glucosamine-1-phosphate N-acetyltransferase
MATAELDDPTGYGRVIRDGKGEFVEIIEQADATPAQLEIREVFPSYYCIKSEELLFALARLKNENKKGEYYLTDIYGILREAGRKIVAVRAVPQQDVLGVNTRQQLADVDAILQERIQRQHRDAGVTIISSVGAYIEDGATIGADTVIHPFTFIGRDSSIGPDCVIGPFAQVPRESIVPEGTTVPGGLSLVSRSPAN